MLQQNISFYFGSFILKCVVYQIGTWGDNKDSHLMKPKLYYTKLKIDSNKIDIFNTLDSNCHTHRKF